MQAVFFGKGTGSLARKNAPLYKEAERLKFQFLPSKSKTYWSTQETMRLLVDDIIAPYFDKKKKELDLPPEQHSIWRIDCWSVHRSEEFRTWMKASHPTIFIIYVPGGCTGLFQPLDVGIQRPLKQSFKRTFHRDIVKINSRRVSRLRR